MHLFQFFYQEVDFGLFFIETNIDNETKTLTAEFKAEVEESVSDFIKMYTDAVQRKWNIS